MSNYADKLADRERKHIRETVTVTSLIGRPAHEDSRRELDERNAEMVRLKAAVAINPITGRAANIDAFVAMCNKIVDALRSAHAARYSSLSISSRSPRSLTTRRTTARLSLRHSGTYACNGHVDNCAANQLYLAMHFSGNNPLFPDTRTSTTYSAPKGPRHFKPSPLKK